MVDEATYSLGYDARGRITTSPGADLTFDVHNRLATAQAEGLTEAYLYDGDGVMVGRLGNGGLEQYAWESGQMIGAYDTQGSAKWEALWGQGQDVLLGFYDYMAGRDVVPVRDWRNNVVSALDVSTGLLLGHAEYTAEGRVTTFDNDSNVVCFEEGSGQVCPMPGNLPFAFNGQWRSPLTDLSYMRNRWYSPRLGQFISHDPLHYIDSTNMYAFAAFDPINSWDPMGLESGGNLAASTRDFVLAVDELMINVADANRAMTETAIDENKSHEGMSDAEIYARAIVAGLQAIYQALTPQTGEQAWEAAIITPAAKGVGTATNAANKVWRNERRLARAEAKLAQQEAKEAARAEKEATRAQNKAQQTERAAAKAKVCSFTEDTPVLMCDGSLRAIQEVEEGEWVLAQNEETGEVSCRQVVAPYDNPGRSIILVTLEDTDGQTEVIETTDNHPFYVEGRGCWTRVDGLEPGDVVPSATGVLVVVGLEWTSRIETVYNFGVDEYHTYFVGELGAWVHNCYDALKDKLGNMGREEFERLTARWGNLRDGAKLEDVLRHKEGKWGPLDKYLRRADAFNKRGATKKMLDDGAIRFEKGNGEFLIERDGKIVGYGNNLD